jgi:RNA polymerase sigma-70 factor (ECF subfamily)
MPLTHFADAKPTALEDDLLLQQAHAGDQRAFECLVERHGPWLLRRIDHTMRDDQVAQDILQQVWLRLYRSLFSLRLQGTLPAWLARVALNCCVDELRRKRLPTFSELAAGEGEEVPPVALLLDPAPLSEELVERQELHQSLLAAIGTLPPRMQAVVLLRAEAELSYGEIGQELGIPVSTAKTIFFRAKRLLCASYKLDGS